jgi:hypothetical protein
VGFVLDCHILSDYFRFLALSSDDISPTQKFTDGVTDKFDKTLLPLKWVSGIVNVSPNPSRLDPLYQPNGDLLPSRVQKGKNDCPSEARTHDLPIALNSRTL